MINSEIDTIYVNEENIEAIPESYLKLEERWSSLMSRYDPIFWDENFPETTIELHIPNPENLIKYRSEQLTQVLETEYDLQELIMDISLLTRISEANNIKIETESPLYRVVLEMSNIPNNEFEHLQFHEIFVLADTSKRALNLLPETEENTELRDMLADLTNRSYNFLREYHAGAYHEDRKKEVGPDFYPDNYILIPGEESHYNNTNLVYQGEHALLTKYNIYTSETETTYFKSCGIIVMVEPQNIVTQQDIGTDTATIDFTPFNSTDPGEVEPIVAITMAYRGMKNFLHAFEEQQLGNNNLVALSGHTNPTMAKFASRFGFRVKVGKDWLDIKDIKNLKTNPDDFFHVKGNIEDIRRALEEFEKKGFGEKIVKDFGKNRTFNY